MKSFFAFFVYRPLLVNIAMFFIFLIGIQSLRTAVFSYTPSFLYGAYTITTGRPGTSAENVELSITVPLEEELLKVDRIKKMTSSSLEGLSVITLTAHDNVTDKEFVEFGNDLQRAIERAVARMPSDLPQKPILKEVSAGDKIVGLLLSGDVSEDLLRKVARQVEDELRELKGVAGVDKQGYREKEILILLDPLTIHQLGISFEEIEFAIRSHNVNESGGSIESFVGEQEIIALNQFADPKDVGNVIVRSNQLGDYVRVRDIAEIVADYEDRSVRNYMDGKPGIVISIRKATEASELAVTERVRELVDNIRDRFPSGVELSIIDDESRITKLMIQMLVSNALAGIVLVLIVLSLFFPLRTSIWVALGIPTAVFIGISLMPWFGLTINQMTLVAIILMLGLLVDDAIVTGESIFRSYEQGLSPEVAAIDGTAVVAGPVIVGAATTLLAFTPLIFLEGQAGRFMWMMPTMVMLIIVGSLIECKTILPAHISESLKKKNDRQVMVKWFVKVENVYRVVIRRILRLRYIGLILLTLFFLLVFLAAFKQIKIDLYPDVDIDVVFVSAEMPVGTSTDSTYENLRLVEQHIQNLLDKEDMENMYIAVGHHSDGRPKSAEDGRQPSWGMISIFLKPQSIRELDGQDFMRTLRSELAIFPQFKSLTVSAKLNSPPLGEAIELQLIGNGEERIVAADTIIDFLAQHPAVTSVWSSYNPGKDIINVDFDHEKVAARGLRVTSIIKAIRVAFDGYIIDELQTVGERIKYRLQFQKSDHAGFQTLNALTIVNDKGQLIPLRGLVDFEVRQGQSSIKHYFGKRSETIYADIDKDKISVSQINQEVANFIDESQLELRFPALRIRMLGEQNSQSETVGNMGSAAIVIILGIFFLMVLLFNSLTQPLIVLAVIPFGFSGVLLGFMFHGFDLSVTAMTGFLGLMGVLVNSAIVLIDRLNQFREEGRVSIDNLVEGSVYRLRPIVITTLTTVAGLMPAAYGWLGSSPLLTPMMMAMLWGVAFGSVITLFYLPCLYSIEQDLRFRLFAKKSM